MHDRKAQAVRKTESRVLISFIEVQGGALDFIIGSDDSYDMTGQEAPGKPDGLAWGELGADQGDRLVQDVVRGEEVNTLLSTTSLNGSRFFVVSVVGILQGIEGRRIDEE